MALTYNDPLFQQGIIEYAGQADWELDISTVYMVKCRSIGKAMEFCPSIFLVGNQFWTGAENRRSP